MEQKLPIFFHTWAGLPATVAVLPTSRAAAGRAESATVASATYRVLVIEGLLPGLLVPRGGIEPPTRGFSSSVDGAVSNTCPAGFVKPATADQRLSGELSNRAVN